MASTVLSYADFIKSRTTEELARITGNPTVVAPAPVVAATAPVDGTPTAAVPVVAAPVPAPGTYSQVVQDAGPKVLERMGYVPPKGASRYFAPQVEAKAAVVDTLQRGAEDLRATEREVTEISKEKEAVTGKYADKADAINAQVDADAEVRRKRALEVEERMAKDWKTFTEPTIEPERWQRIVGGVVRVLGAIGASGGSVGGSVLGAAMNEAEDAIYRDVNDQLRRKVEAGKRMEFGSAYEKSLWESSNGQAEFAAKTIANHFAVMGERLNGLADKAKTAEARSNLRQGALMAEVKGHEAMAEIYGASEREDDKIKAQAAAARAAKLRLASQEPDYSRVPEDVLRGLVETGKAPGGMVAYVAELDKKKREAVGKPGKDSTEADIPGFRRVKDVAPAQVTRANTAEAATNSMVARYARLKALREEAQSKDASVSRRNEIETEARQIIGSLADTASQLAGGGQAGEAAKKQLLDDMPLPTQWDLLGRQDPATVYDRLAEQAKRDRDAILRGLGYESLEPPKPPPPDKDSRLSGVGRYDAGPSAVVTKEQPAAASSRDKTGLDAFSGMKGRL